MLHANLLSNNFGCKCALLSLTNVTNVTYEVKVHLKVGPDWYGILRADEDADIRG